MGDYLADDSELDFGTIGPWRVLAGTGGDIGGHDRREADLKSKQAGQLASLSNSSIG